MRNAPRRSRRSPIAFAALVVISVVVALALGTSQETEAPAMLVKLEPVEGSPLESAGAVLVRLPLEPDDDGKARTIVEGFEIAGAPRVSFDGRRAVFSGRREASRPLEIWEVDAAGSAPPRRVVAGGDCLEPCYLPGDAVVYSRSVAEDAADAGGRGHDPAGASRRDTAGSLHRASLAGGGERRITFGNGEDRAPELLPDGSVVFRRRQPPAPGRLFAVRTDGTGLELFCEPANGSSIVAGPWLAGDLVLFVEEPARVGEGVAGDADRGARPPSRLIAVRVEQPLGERRVLAVTGTSVTGTSTSLPAAARPTSVACLEGGRILASFPSGRDRGLLVEAHLRQSPGARPAFSELELPGISGALRPVAVAIAAPRRRPLELTTVVDESGTTGTLFCADVRNSRLGSVARLAPGAELTVRVLTADGRVGTEAAVEADGSFAVEVPADRPLRLQIHGDGGFIAEDASGFWVRPNESRGCLGCHEDPELAPVNRVLDALDGGADAPAVPAGGRAADTEAITHGAARGATGREQGES